MTSNRSEPHDKPCMRDGLRFCSRRCGDCTRVSEHPSHSPPVHPLWSSLPSACNPTTTTWSLHVELAPSDVQTGGDAGCVTLTAGWLGPWSAGECGRLCGSGRLVLGLGPGREHPADASSCSGPPDCGPGQSTGRPASGRGGGCSQSCAFLLSLASASGKCSLGLHLPFIAEQTL